MNITVLFNKLFVGGKWYVAYRDYKSLDQGYKVINMPIGQWLADPFLYEFEGKHYLFAEQYSEYKQRAGIGVFEFIDGQPVNNKIILERDYHISYPCVFYYKGHHYMIPESSANNTIDLYECTRFPYDWSHKKVLLSGEKYLDSTVYIDDDNIYIISYKSEASNWKVVVFQLDMTESNIVKIAEKHYKKNTGRPAGYLFNSDKLYRPSQDCHKKYGERILINEVAKCSSDGFEEYYSKSISFNDLCLPIKAQRIHTINRDSQYEVIDLFKEQIDIFHAFRILKRKYSL